MTAEVLLSYQRKPIFVSGAADSNSILRVANMIPHFIIEYALWYDVVSV